MMTTMTRMKDVNDNVIINDDTNDDRGIRVQTQVNEMGSDDGLPEYFSKISENWLWARG